MSNLSIVVELLMPQKSRQQFYVSKISKIVSSKLYQIENQKNSEETV